MLLFKKAQFPNGSLTLKREFELTSDQLQKVYIATSLTTASALEPPQSQLGTVFQIIKFKPSGKGPAQLIYHTFTLLQSHYLNCQSSLLGQLLVNSMDPIHRDLFCFSGLAQFISQSASMVSTSCRRACRHTPGLFSVFFFLTVIFFIGMTGGCPGHSWLVGACIWFVRMSSIAFASHKCPVERRQ